MGIGNVAGREGGTGTLNTSITPVIPASAMATSSSSNGGGKVSTGRGKLDVGDGQRVCTHLTNGLKAARLGLGLGLPPASKPGLGKATGPGLSHDDYHRSAAGISQSLRYLKEAFSALCKLGAGRCCRSY